MNKRVDNKPKIFYMCGVDWQHELGETDTRLYKTLKELKEYRACWKQCGIVRIEVTAKWIRKQTI